MQLIEERAASKKRIAELKAEIAEDNIAAEPEASDLPDATNDNTPEEITALLFAISFLQRHVDEDDPDDDSETNPHQCWQAIERLAELTQRMMQNEC